jgi:hypothetical protein
VLRLRASASTVMVALGATTHNFAECNKEVVDSGPPPAMTWYGG